MGFHVPPPPPRTHAELLEQIRVLEGNIAANRAGTALASALFVVLAIVFVVAAIM